MAVEARPGCSIFPPHLLKVLAGRQRHAMAHQNGLVALRMMHILFLGNKLDRVAEDGRRGKDIFILQCQRAFQKHQMGNETG